MRRCNDTGYLGIRITAIIFISMKPTPILLVTQRGHSTNITYADIKNRLESGP
jgi:hypothetical protein